MVNTLIALVLSLLVQVQQPNVPVQFKIQALEIANQILLVAKADENATTTQPISEVAVTSTNNQEGTSTNDSNIATTTQTIPVVEPVVAGATPALEAPTCTLTAQAVAVPGFGWRVLFTWHFTQGSYATISSGGNVIVYPGKGSTWNDSLYYGSAFFVNNPRYYYLFGATDYEMDVSLGGLIGSCIASTSIPTGN